MECRDTDGLQERGWDETIRIGYCDAYGEERTLDRCLISMTRMPVPASGGQKMFGARLMPYYFFLRPERRNRLTDRNAGLPSRPMYFSIKITPPLSVRCDSGGAVQDVWNWLISETVQASPGTGCSFPAFGAGNRFVMLLRLIPRVDILWSRAESVGGMIPATPSTIRAVLNETMKR